jgi:hypothetical protein
MLLSDINRFFATHKRACLADLAGHFDAEPDALLPMLDVLAAKGRIARVTSGSNCGGCTKCDPNRLVIYEWKGQAGRP